MVCLYWYYCHVIDLNKKLGQMFFVGFEGYTLTKEIRNSLQTIQPGGIVFFECNIKDKKQVKKLINDINASLEIKPFITVDQEGGSVERLRNICTSLPSVWGLSKIGLKELLEAQKIIAEELLELGFNMVLAPVLDINSNSANPIIGSRSISNNPKVVSEYGSEVIKLFLKHKIIPVAKHFPGHGDLELDSHLALPVLSKNKTQLNTFELVPFKKAIQIKAPVIMVGHIQLPLIEKNKLKPASLSKAVLSDLLRKELGFKGLIITDELNMKGVTKNFTLQNASLEAMKAGADLVLFNWDFKSTFKTYKVILGKIQKDKNLQERIEESYKRIITTKKKYLVRMGFLPTSISKNRLLSYNLANKVVHWIKRDLFFKPLSSKESIEIIYPKTHRLRREDLEKICDELALKKVHLYEYDINPPTKSISKLAKKTVRANQRVCPMVRRILITYDMAVRKNQRKLLNVLLNLNPNLIVISVGLEYDIEIAPKIKNFIAAYAPNYISLKSAFKKIFNL